MSRSPLVPGLEDEVPEYIDAWRATHRLIREGGSWSGKERDVALGNDGRGGFVDLSATSGLDLLRDGRSTAWTDHDGDGGMDLFTKSRNGVRLRFLRNQAERGHWLQFDLVGTSGNRDAIGARVQVQAEGATLRAQTLRAGSGYMAQSSKRLHFGLGELGAVSGVTVDWPGGESELFEGLTVDGRFRLVQGEGRAVLVEAPQPTAALQGAQEAAPTAETRRPSTASIPLAPRLPLPLLPAITPGGVPTDASAVREGRSKLVLLWASWCAPCLAEMQELAAEAERLAAAGIEVLALHADPNEDRRALDATLRAMRWPHEVAFASRDALDALDLLQQHALERQERMVLPSAFFVDPQGRVAIYHRGPVGADQLLREVLNVAAEPSPTDQRKSASPLPGRWISAPARSGAADFEARLLRDLGGEVADAYNVRALQDLAAIDNSKARTYLEFGKARMAQRKLEEAEEQFVAALQLDPTLFEAWANLAPVLQKQERFDEAIEAYESALRLKPDSTATRFNLGIAYLESGALEAAERVAAEVGATHPEWAQRLRDLIAGR